MKELDIATLADEVTAPGLIKEATQKPTHPTGTYKMRIEKAGVFENEDTGQQTAQFVGILYTLPPEGQTGEETFVGRHAFYAYWGGYRKDDGSLTGESKRWGLLLKALGLDESTRLEKVFQTAREYPVMIHISEAYQIDGPDGSRSYTNAPHRNPDMIPDPRAQARSREYAEQFVQKRLIKQAEGYRYTLKNFTQSIWKVT